MSLPYCAFWNYCYSESKDAYFEFVQNLLLCLLRAYYESKNMRQSLLMSIHTNSEGFRAFSSLRKL